MSGKESSANEFDFVYIHAIDWADPEAVENLEEKNLDYQVVEDDFAVPQAKVAEERNSLLVTEEDNIVERSNVSDAKPVVFVEDDKDLPTSSRGEMAAAFEYPVSVEHLLEFYETLTSRLPTKDEVSTFVNGLPFTWIAMLFTLAAVALSFGCYQMSFGKSVLSQVTTAAENSTPELHLPPAEKSEAPSALMVIFKDPEELLVPPVFPRISNCTDVLFIPIAETPVSLDKFEKKENDEADATQSLNGIKVREDSE
ncbi:hypothetical protein HDU96_009701 [Phlyctochytrium bullatum]|nr:hypothetical protein HDU96_009701 [Phlyctochytrium bullatum]